jgi:hypothetical protein
VVVIRIASSGISFGSGGRKTAAARRLRDCSATGTATRGKIVTILFYSGGWSPVNHPQAQKGGEKRKAVRAFRLSLFAAF